MAAKAVARLVLPGRHALGGVPGLYLEVSPTGVRAYLFRYRDRRTGKLRDKGLGAAHTVDLAAAREKARRCRQLLDEGHDPIDHDRTARRAAVIAADAARTFGWCLEQYIASRVDGWKNEKHKAQWLNSVKTHAANLIAMNVWAIETPHVVAALSPIWTTKTETASRVRMRIEAVLGWATTAELRSGENPARWKNHLENLLASPATLKTVVNHEAVHYRAVPAVMARIQSKDTQAARALRMIVLTGLRAGEVTGARWSEFDLERGVWTVPAARMKGSKAQRKDHEVPIFAALRTHLASLPRLSDEYLFPGSGQKRPTISTDAVLNCLQDLGPDVATATTHGFRSAFRDWAGDCTAFESDIVEMALAHTIKNKVVAAYRRTTALEKRRELMTAWATYIDAAPKKKGRARA